MPLRDDLLRTIGAGRPAVPITDDTPLIQSGVIDSVGLFNLMLWVEEQTGRPIDPTTLDVREELNTVASILRLVGRLSGDGASPGPS